ncbi:MAG: HAMP domain-containing histidine kinase [Planctomycetes bacterium]|nr:HAMP domain-containing histidine kinase [Planctomycetota bacterium]
MTAKRQHFSRGHLLALCTFLVPLGVLAWLGQSELQRSGSAAREALEREARTFLQSAAQALAPQFDRLPPIVEHSRQLLAAEGPVRTTLALRDQDAFPPLLDIVLLDEASSLVWPEPPLPSLGLPFARDARPRGTDTAIAATLRTADLLLQTGRIAEAATVLQRLITRFEEANPPQPRTGRRELDDQEVAARFQLGAARRKLGDLDAARTEFEKVAQAGPRRGGGSGAGFYGDVANLSLLAESALAELGTSGDRVRLLRAIAESRREAADGLLSALAVRLAERVPNTDPLHAEAQVLLREERQRAQTRAIAVDYDAIQKAELRRRLQREAGAGNSDLQLVSTFGSTTMLLWVRDATDEERSKRRCSRVGLHFDIGQLLAPALPQLVGGTGSFALAISDPNDVPMVPPPREVPADFAPPLTEVHGLVLRAFPANTEKLLRDAQAAAQNRTLLFVALFFTALAGALWLWRSVSREAELAALKVDLVSRVSHELKTPLALIRMYGETLGLGRARDSEQAAQFGGIIARESERLTTLIQRILDFSRQQAGTLQYTPQHTDLTTLARNVCAAYAPHLESRGAVLIDTLTPGVFVDCDANACESALVNLLENAAKYGIEGDDEHEIEVDLRTRGGEAWLEVRDRGRGIPDHERDRVFDGFYRASNSGEVRGAGLGLSLVRHFARAHGGDVTSQPRDGGGSVFRLALPLSPPETASPGSTPTQTQPQRP